MVENLALKGWFNGDFMKCSECEYAKFLSSCQAYTCEHPECKDAIIFKGKTKPHACPLCGVIAK